jgi:anti-sigma regulatory factor (Ser/Thr protein kinase)
MRDLSLHLMDIIQNSVSACAGRVNIEIRTNIESGMLSISISDNGKGMDKELLDKVTDPFTTTRKTRKVGLGLPLLKATAELSGGNLEVYSQKGDGTRVEVNFKIDSIDRPPLGDVAGTIVNILAANPEIEFEMIFDNGSSLCKTFSTNEVKKHLGDVPINNYDVLEWIKDFIEENIKVTFGGVLYEVIS